MGVGNDSAQQRNVATCQSSQQYIYQLHISTTYAWSHLAKTIEDAVQYDEERQDLLYREDCAADDEPHDRPKDEAESHGLSPTDFVHQETSDEAPWQVKSIDGGAETDGLDQLSIWIEARDDRRAVNAERVDLHGVSAW